MTNILLYAATVLIWGSTWFAITFQLGDVPMEWSVSYRFALAAVIMFGFCLATGRSLRFPLRGHLLFLLLGSLLFSGNYYFAYWSTEYLTSGLVAVAFSMISLSNILNGAIFLRHGIEARLIVGSLIGLSGLVMVFWPEFEAISLSDTTVYGALLALIGSYLASLGNTVVASPAGQRQPIFAFNAWAMFYGCVLMAAVATVSGRPMVFSTEPAYLLSLLYLSLIGSVAAFTLYLTLISRIGLGRAAYMGVLLPVVALLISTAFEGYEWSWLAVSGMGLVIAGNLFSRRRMGKPGGSSIGGKAMADGATKETVA